MRLWRRKYFLSIFFLKADLLDRASVLAKSDFSERCGLYLGKSNGLKSVHKWTYYAHLSDFAIVLRSSLFYLSESRN